MFGRLKPILRGVRGPHAHSVYVVEGETLVFGRASAADIQILDQRVSRQHARLHVEGDTVFLEDLQSHNGTFVHGFQVHRRALRPGDRFRIGVAEYTFDKVRDKLLTSAVFFNKLTTRETLGATIVRKAAHEILNSPTAEMPATEAESSSGERPTRELTALGNHPLPAERPARGRTPGPSSEPAYVTDARSRAIDLPAQRPRVAAVVRTPIPLANAATAALAEEPPVQSRPTPQPAPRPAPKPAVGLPTVDAPELQALLNGMSDARPLEEAELAEFTTVPLDPKSQRVRTPIPRGGATLEPPRSQLLSRAPLARSPVPAPVPAPEPASAPRAAPSPTSGDAHDATVRTIDAVMRLLALRFQESGGAPLRVTDRANLRKLEQALRDAKRGSANRRRWSRRPCELQAEVGPTLMSAQVLDIGAGGLRIGSTELTVIPGDRVTVRVHLGEGRLSRMAIFETKVAWVDDSTQTFGGAFSGPATWKLADQP